MGRPKKENAVKSGQLSGNLCRFSFIANKQLVAIIKLHAQQADKSIKDYMHEILIAGVKPVKKKETVNEEKLKDYLKTVRR